MAGWVCLRGYSDAKTAVLNACETFIEAQSLYGKISLQTADGAILIASIANTFKVSEDAARVRLLKLGIVTEASAIPSLFS